MGTNSGTRRRKRKFPQLFVKLWSWSNRNCPLMRSALSWLVLQSGTALVVPAGTTTAGTTRAVPDCSTNRSSADRIVVNSYNHHWYRQWLGAWTAPNHYLNQCWNIANWTLGNKLLWNFKRIPCIFIEENVFECVVSDMAAICLGLNVLKPLKIKLWLLPGMPWLVTFRAPPWWILGGISPSITVCGVIINLR